MSEASETQSWLEFSFACEYIDEKLYNDLDSVYELIIAKLNRMERKADTFCYRAS